MTRFIIESREPPEIQTMGTVAQFDTGDILHPSSGLLIERKAVSDLLASMRDGRLDNQCARLSTTEILDVTIGGVMVKMPIKHNALVIHGSLWPQGQAPKVKANGRETGWNYWAVMMKLVSIQESGIVTLIIPHRCLTECVEKLAAWAAKSQHRAVRRQRPQGMWASKPAPRSELMTILAGSQQRAEVILKEYGTPGGALPYLDEWSKLSGVGEGTVKRAKAILGDVPSMIPFG